MLEFINVCKSYNKEDGPVLSDLSFRVAAGEFILLTGRSGIGKSTIIKLILKETEPDSGSIVVQEQDITSLDRQRIPFYRRKLGVVFQDFRLIQGLSVYKNIDVARICTGGRRSDSFQRISSILRMLGIDRLHKRKPGELSGGEQQKVCIARALVNSPIIILADEPTGNLDPAASREIMELFDMLHKRDITVIVATHDISQAHGLDYREIHLSEVR